MGSAEKLGTCVFELFHRKIGPHRVDYKLNITDKRIPQEFLLTRSLPLFLEHNIGKVDFEARNNVLTQLPVVIGVYEGGKELKIPMSTSLDETIAARFTTELFIENTIYITNHYKQFSTSLPINVNIAFHYTIVGTLGLALSRLSKQAADELKFFVAYGLLKWRREGYPGAITAFTKTWDFSNINKMIMEWNTWSAK